MSGPIEFKLDLPQRKYHETKGETLTNKRWHSVPQKTATIPKAVSTQTVMAKSALHDNLRVGRLFECVPEMMACQSACNHITCLSSVNAAK